MSINRSTIVDANADRLGTDGWVATGSGYMLHLPSCDRAYTYDSAGNVLTDTAFDGVHTFTKTFTWTANRLTSQTGWTFVS